MVFSSLEYTLALATEFIMAKRGKKSSFFFALEIREAKKETLPEQKNTGKIANEGDLWEILGNTKII